MKTIALVLKGYPRLSETFIAQEIYELEQQGMDITLVSLRHPTDKKRHPVHEQIQARVMYLPEYLYQEPLRVLKAWWQVRPLPGYAESRHIWWQDLKRDPSPNRIRRFGQALVLAAEMPAGIEHLYAHFLHTPASVTRYASLINQLPWSCSAHAKDIWTSPEWELREKLQSLRWLATCTEANFDYLRSLAAEPARVNLVYHGLDFKRFPAPDPLVYRQHDGHDPKQPVQLISVGRAVPKKGYDILLSALASLPADLHWQFTHIGGGGLLPALRAQAEQLGIAGRIHWAGSMNQADVLQAYRQSDLFVLASKIVADGDRDGLPNVLMEAQSQGICCLSTHMSGIPELIEQNVTGVMVAPESVEELATQLQTLISQPALRARLGQAGLHRLRAHFDVGLGIRRLVHLFNQA